MKVDLLVDDIYGKSSHSLGLDGKIVASSMGKYGNKKDIESNDYDIVRSLVISFAVNVANLTSLGLRKYGADSAIVLSDKIHFKPFYCLVQVYHIFNSVSFKRLRSIEKSVLCSEQSFPQLPWKSIIQMIVRNKD